MRAHLAELLTENLLILKRDILSSEKDYPTLTDQHGEIFDLFIVVNDLRELRSKSELVAYDRGDFKVVVYVECLVTRDGVGRPSKTKRADGLGDCFGSG